MLETQRTVNEMLYEAITTDSRKRKCRWQTELEALGFKIIKDGAWYIRYEKTNRFIELPYNEDSLRTSNGYIRFGRVWKKGNYKKGNYGHYVDKPLSCINLEGLLTKRPVKAYESNWTNVDHMQDALYDRKRHTRNLKTLMADYQKKIDNLTKEYQNAIEQAKKHYDWELDYHTKGLASANETISKLLHKTHKTA